MHYVTLHAPPPTGAPVPVQTNPHEYTPTEGGPDPTPTRPASHPAEVITTVGPTTRP